MKKREKDMAERYDSNPLAPIMDYMDYIDFIDAPAVRDHLRTLLPLPPAQRCILIAQSGIRPLTDKLAALREIRDATSPEDFSRGCWKFQCDDPFPVILDRYLRTRAERLVTFRKVGPGVVYVVESGYRNGSALFSTFDAALASVKELEDDESPPVIRRRRIDDTDGATLVAELSRKLEIAEIDVRGGPDAGNMRIWGGDLPNGYAHVPHPFKRGDIVRQGDAYFVLDGCSDEGGRFSWGTDEDDMQLYGMSWDKPSGSFCHEHVFYTRGSTELVAPADLPEKERMLAAVSLLMRGEYDLINFLQCFTCGDRKTLETDAIADAKREASPKKRKDENRILRSDLPGLPANLFLRASCFRGFTKAVRVQRSGDTEPHYRDTVELTLEAAPRFNGGTGDLSPDGVQTIRDLVARHLDAFLANWDGKMSSDDLLAALRDGTRPVNDTVYTAIMSPVGQHPSKCRIGVCSGTPILESGWILHSSLITENAERIYAEIIELLNSLRKQNYDAENDAWMVPINALDKWMTSCEKRLRMRTSQQTTIVQNGGNNDQE